MGFDSKRKAEVHLTVEGPTEPAKKVPEAKPLVQSGKERDWSLAANLLKDPETLGDLDALAALIHVSGWCQGSWRPKRHKGGWKDELTGRFVSIEQLQDAIDARISELGLDRQIIENWMKASPRHAADQAWEALPFEIRMQTFRRGVQ
jgi:hypothetical protein